MGKMAIDALNSGNWYPDSDPENAEGRAAPDNRGGQFPLGGLSKWLVGIAVAALTPVLLPNIVGIGAGAWIMAVALTFTSNE